MPECPCSGVRASLLITSLSETITTDINLRMGKNQTDHARRIAQSLAAGRRLVEQPLADHSAVQHLDGDSRLLLHTVRASDTGQFFDRHHTGDGHGEVPRANGSHNIFVLDERLMSRESDSSPETTQQPQKPMAISLLIETSLETYRALEHEKFESKDLMIEAYLNGSLVHVVLVQCRNKHRATCVSDGKFLLSGTRIHRQIEKPWVYESEPCRSSLYDVAARWSSIGSQLYKSAINKGSHNNTAPLSGLFLEKLSLMALPEELKYGSGRFAVLDVVLVAGSGMKYSQMTTYLKTPTLLRDPKYQFCKEFDSQKGQTGASYDDTVRNPHSEELPSPERTLARSAPSRVVLSQTPTRGRPADCHDQVSPCMCQRLVVSSLG